MNLEEKILMARYGITCTPKMMYFYRQYRYANLADALSYAESDARNEHKNTSKNTLTNETAIIRMAPRARQVLNCA